MDGAGHWQMFSQIMLPLARPSLSTIAIFYFMWVWNEFIYPLVYMQTPGEVHDSPRRPLLQRPLHRRVGLADGGAGGGHDRAAGRLLRLPEAVHPGDSGGGAEGLDGHRYGSEPWLSSVMRRQASVTNGAPPLTKALPTALSPIGPIARSSTMERGVYFDAWFPGQHCYHPSLPPRRLRMVEHLVDYHATVLVWAALGGGSISLPYLEQEAFGEIDPRFRFYGFVNDAEFIAECRKHGHQGLRHRLRGPGLGVPGRAERGRGPHPGPQRAARRRQARTGWGCASSRRTATRSSGRRSSTTSPAGWSTATASRSTDLLDEALLARHLRRALPRALGGVPGSRALLLHDGPQQPGLARVPEGDHPHPDRRRGRRRAARRGGAAADDAPVRRLLLQGLSQGLPRLPAVAAGGRAARRAAGRRI